ncbi:unnamed protein product [Schistosoma turkestanicum]|nr:unnamed protein product [Schistosoma turkestanicum]
MKMFISHILSYLVVLDLILQIDSTRNKITTKQSNNQSYKPTFTNQTIQLRLEKECRHLLENIAINKNSEIICKSLANLTINLLLLLSEENHNESISQINLDLCTGCKITVRAVKFILTLSQVTYYVDKFIDWLCIFTGPYLSECSFVAQRYAGILINLLENTTVPKICQKIVKC